jgi:periplasmic protein TonB
MERPSHIILKSSHPCSRRLTALVLALSLPVAVIWGLTQDMAVQIIKHTFGPVQLVPVEEAVPPASPPPLPPMKEIPQLKAPEPVFRTEQPQAGNGNVTPQPPSQSQSSDTQAVPDRAPVGVASTHTIPPYPMLEQRLGVEGKVTLRLSVLADGTVGRAEIVASSGRSDLDAAAQDWIVAHWTYRPALHDGQPVPAQTLATVIFSLRNER